ncbi:NAD(P)/FAD-dependent oxidoreductase [Streptomyces sp. NPDC005708]|uniref:flavin-containing monooxygenase n=1 Tax=Streptomyces sp. NPDC005708 TaxID=3154564 RepID=UPI0033C5E7A2
MRVVVVGAGFGGIAAAIELGRYGFDDLEILEAAPEPGGTWYFNRYPGAACDVPSHLYSYSYAQRSEWSRVCSPGDEILEYMRAVVAEFGVERLITPGTRVTACRWEERSRTWKVSVEDADGCPGATRTADAVVMATGQLHQPALPRIPDLDCFSGHSFHSALWDHGYDLRGKRVAVIGTGASATQFVPEIADQVAGLTVFQRTPNWYLPRINRSYARPVHELFRRVPVTRSLWRSLIACYAGSLTVAIRHPRTAGRLGGALSAAFMRKQLRDPEVRRSALPDYQFGCKRVLFSSTFLPALQRENVELVTESIVRMRPEGPQTADGRVHPVDCVIYGTGFRTNDFVLPTEVTGTGGRTLSEAWSGGPHAHLGITVPRFPNLFLMYGPNTNTSGGSIIFYLEAQAGYLRQALQWVQHNGAAAIEVRPEVEAAGNRALQARFAGTAWTRCDSWYRDGTGRIVANWPGYMREYRKRTQVLDPEEYRFISSD